MIVRTIRSPNYTEGRIRPPRLIVVHTAQVPCKPGRAESVASYLAGAKVRASCHWSTGPDVAVEQVDEGDTAWAAPGANADGIQIEQAAYAEFGSSGRIPASNQAASLAYGAGAVWPSWDDPEVQAMLVVTAEVMAGISARWGIPLRHLTNAELAAGRSGVIGHVQASEVYQQSDHWDPGGQYPYAQVVAWAVELGRTSGPGGTVTPGVKPTIPPPAPVQEDDDMRQYRDVTTGTVYAVSGIFKTPLESDAVRQSWMAMGILAAPDQYFDQNTAVLDELVTLDDGDIQKLIAAVEASKP